MAALAIGLVGGVTRSNGDADSANDAAVSPLENQVAPGGAAVSGFAVSKLGYLQALAADGLIGWDWLVVSDSIETTSVSLPTVEIDDYPEMTEVRLWVKDYDAAEVLAFLMALDPAMEDMTRGERERFMTLLETFPRRSAVSTTTEWFTLARQANGSPEGLTIVVLPLGGG